VARRNRAVDTSAEGGLSKPVDEPEGGWRIWNDIPPDAQAIIESFAPQMKAHLMALRYGALVRITVKPPLQYRLAVFTECYRAALEAGLLQCEAVRRASTAAGMSERQGWRWLNRPQC